MVYGADVPSDEDITVENFASKIDPQSWQEFMPKDVTKELFKKFTRYYDKDIFVAAGKRIRQLAKATDELPPTERVQKIAALFATFKNPDKETVLTPWRVVNMHMSECLGGYDFFDESHEDLLEEPRFVDRGEVTAETLANTKAQILEINSKTGLYPLYVTYSIYRKRCEECKDALTLEKQQELWNLTVKDNVFVICKTPMARSITQRTLTGFTKAKVNAHYFEDLINQLKNKSEQFRAKVIKGSYWKKGDKEMKFDAIVGNPPYQTEATGEANGSDPIYHLFIDAACKIGERVSFVHPARFLFNAGKTPKDWNKKMLNDEHYNVVRYWANSSDVFPTVDIKGGVAVTCWDKNKTFEKIGAFVAYSELRSIMKKVLTGDFNSLATLIYPAESYNFTKLMHKEHPELAKRLSTGHLYDLKSPVLEKLPEVFFNEKPNDDCEYVQVYGRVDNKRTFRWIKRDYLSVPENFDFYKIFLPKANGSGAIGEALSTPTVGEPIVGATQTFLSVGKFSVRNEAENCIKYIKTKFASTMLGTLKVTQDNPRETWQNVPLQDFTEKSDIDWSKSVPEIDKQLYKKYGLSKEEIDFIESKVKEME